MQGHGPLMHQNKSNQHNHIAPQKRRVSSSQQQLQHQSLTPLHKHIKIKQEPLPNVLKIKKPTFMIRKAKIVSLTTSKAQNPDVRNNIYFPI
jgi:hypothetical protein